MCWLPFRLSERRARPSSSLQVVSTRRKVTQLTLKKPHNSQQNEVFHHLPIPEQLMDFEYYSALDLYVTGMSRGCFWFSTGCSPFLTQIEPLHYVVNRNEYVNYEEDTSNCLRQLHFNKQSFHAYIVHLPRKIQISNELIEIACPKTIEIEGDRLVVLSMNLHSSCPPS